MVEKLGHSKRMQVMRREWIDEGKPKRDLDDFPVAVDAERDGTRHEGGAQTGKEVDGSVAAPGEREEAEQAAELERNEPGAHPEGLEDLEEPTQPMSLFGGGRVKKKEKGNQLFVSDDEEEDDLNALLAAQTSNQGMNATAQKQSSDIQKETETQEENFDDDMEAMAGFDDPW
jgi:replication fork protection complex subunit Csm3/Swi3